MIKFLLPKLTDQIDPASKPKLVGYVNIYNYTIYRKNKSLIDGIDLFTLDGIFLVFVLRILSFKKLHRTSPDFSSYFKGLFQYLNDARKTAAFIGASESEIETFVTVVQNKYPNMELAYVHSGYDVEKDGVIDEVLTRSPEYVFVSMGTPKQERFLIELRLGGFKGWGFSSGAFFSQTATEGEQYYPMWVDKLHLRWLYRIYKEPKLFSRYAVDYPKGLILLLKDYLSTSPD